MEQIRSFIAIELPVEVKTALSRLQTQLKAVKPSPVKWVDPLGMHLTLKFLGDITADKVDDITRAIEAAVQGIPPFQLEVKGLGVFPNLSKARVAWVGMSGDLNRLTRLQQRIESNLAPLGFAPETRSFTPHLTLARVRDSASPVERDNFGQLIASTKFEEAYSFTVECVHLIKSQLTRERAIYSQIGSVKLK